MFRALVYDDWSWTAVAQALTRGGITWRTARAWSAEGLRREIVRASIRSTPADKHGLNRLRHADARVFAVNKKLPSAAERATTKQCRISRPVL
jgi:hypothetical protein